MKRIVIIGGGISGLSAAWEVQRRSPGTQVTLIEARDGLGGRIRTERIDGFVIEHGPDAFLTQKPAAIELATELGIIERVQGTNDEARTIFVLHKGNPVPMPAGFQLIVPTQLGPFLRSPLISPLGKARMLTEVTRRQRGGGWMSVPPRPWRRHDPTETKPDATPSLNSPLSTLGSPDESVANFVRRRFGKEAAETFAEPMLAGIYNADVEQQSLEATFPRFREMEQSYGSLIRASRATKKASSGHRPSRSMFASFRTGMQELPDALARRLSADIRLRTRVASIEQRGTHYVVALDNGGALLADVLVVTLPARNAAELVRPLTPAAASQLDALRTVSTGAVTLAYRDEQIPRALEGFGLVVPRKERRPINAITVASTKFTGRAPEGCALFRVFFGGERSAETFTHSDRDLVELVRRELYHLMGITAAPSLVRIDRWPDASPQYDVGHLERIAGIEAALPPGILLTGSAYRGVGIPDCIANARHTAAVALDVLPARR